MVMLEVQSYPSLPRCSSEDNLLGYPGYLYEEIYPQTGERRYTPRQETSFGGNIYLRQEMSFDVERSCFGESA